MALLVLAGTITLRFAVKEKVRPTQELRKDDVEKLEPVKSLGHPAKRVKTKITVNAQDNDHDLCINTDKSESGDSTVCAARNFYRFMSGICSFHARNLVVLRQDIDQILRVYRPNSSRLSTEFFAATKLPRRIRSIAAKNLVVCREEYGR